MVNRGVLRYNGWRPWWEEEVDEDDSPGYYPIPHDERWRDKTERGLADGTRLPRGVEEY